MPVEAAANEPQDQYPVAATHLHGIMVRSMWTLLAPSTHPTDPTHKT
ncbi:hypothetical protein HMPREF9577_00393 [Cutibacterium acnes HL110PA3]|nr:hypothetical protein HMPREF9603_01913 [Cutibacterium acnes HL001PA1]EFT27036.1 hypothetical protein HMPREF9577_00393 [Cutibacterium acnes HL110PA3]EFT77181.1 hypothetical protein HMPREF9599_01606 [Cutibacterium acnes HL050PA2]